MPRIPDTSDAQSAFLRAFRTSTGPTDWPAPAILRRWLRQPPFLNALNSLLETLRFQSDFHLATAAVHAAAELAQPPSESPSPAKDSPSKLHSLSILRLAHARQRSLAVESRHTDVQTLTAELEKAQSELADLRAQLDTAQRQLRLSVPLDPFILQRPQKPQADPAENDPADPNPVEAPHIPEAPDPADSTAEPVARTAHATEDALDTLDAAAQDGPADAEAPGADPSEHAIGTGLGRGSPEAAVSHKELPYINLRNDIQHSPVPVSLAPGPTAPAEPVLGGPGGYRAIASVVSQRLIEKC